MLGCYVEGNDEWVKYLYMVLFAYRTSKHSTTGVSPFQLMYWRDSPVSFSNIQEFVEGQLIQAQNGRKITMMHTIFHL